MGRAVAYGLPVQDREPAPKPDRAILTRGDDRMLNLPPMRVPCLPRGSHPPSLPPLALESSPEEAASGTGPKYGWAGAATPTQRNITRTPATAEDPDYGMFNGTPLAAKGNPTWPFSRVPEPTTPWRNELLNPAAR